MSSQQKVFQISVLHGPYAISTFDIPSPGPGELLVKVLAVALNPADWKQQATHGHFRDVYPAILGLDGAGVVEALGEGTAGFAVGDRILFPGYASNRYATFKQWTVVKPEYAAKIPDTMSFDEAATIAEGITTAVTGLFNQDKDAAKLSAGLCPPWEEGGRGKYAGRPLVVVGASSSTGQNFIQVAKLAGFSPIIATASAHNHEFIRSLGATHVFDRHLPVDALRAEVARITSTPIDLVIDGVAVPETQNLAYSLLAPGGRLVVVTEDAVAPQLKTADKVVQQTFGVAYVPYNHTVLAGLYSHFGAWLERGDIKPNRVELLPGGFHAVERGLERLKAGKVSCAKLVVRPHETS